MNQRVRSLLKRLLAAAPPRLRWRIIAWRSRGRLTVGAGSFLHPSVQILGKAQVAVGSNSAISQDCWLNVNHRERVGHAIQIGNHCFIGRRNVFSSGNSIVLADHVLTANDCHFLGSTHVVSDPMRPVISTGTSATDVIVVGANTFVGAGARLVGHVRIGHGCVIGAGSLVTRDIPPFSQAHGSPATVRRRYSVAKQRWVPAEEFDTQDEAGLPSEAQYLERLAECGPVHLPLIACGSDMGNL